MMKLGRFIGAMPPEKPIGDHVAVIYALGDITDGGGEGVLGARQEIASHTLVAALRALTADATVDIDTFCTLIKQGERTMTDQAQAWKQVADRYFTEEEQARWAEKMAALPAGFDPNAYQAKWAELGSRIAAALPLDPASDTAAAYLAEWNALLKPFNMAADARMKTRRWRCTTAWTNGRARRRRASPRRCGTSSRGPRWREVERLTTATPRESRG